MGTAEENLLSESIYTGLLLIYIVFSISLEFPIASNVSE